MCSETSKNEFEFHENDYTFLEERLLGNKVWKIYGMDYQDHPTILCPKTFVPYQAMEPVVCQRRIGISGDTIRHFPAIIKSGQTVDCTNLENPEDCRKITTS